jgi:hypothetical protein
MNRDEMIKRHWKPYMIVHYKHPRMHEGIDCMLISIHFDDEIVELQPFGENHYQQSFFSGIQNISIPKRLKAVSIGGKKVEREPLVVSNKILKGFNNTNPKS